MAQAAVGAEQGGVSLATRVSYAMRQRRGSPTTAASTDGFESGLGGVACFRRATARLETSRLAQAPSRFPPFYRTLLDPTRSWTSGSPLSTVEMIVGSPRPCKTPTVLKKNGPPREQAKNPFNRISRTTKKRHTLGCTALKTIG